MKLKYNHSGEVHEIPLSTDKSQGKRLAVRHDNQTYYAPLVSVTDSAASNFRLVFGGETLALSTGETPVEIIESFNFSDNANSAKSDAVTLLGNYGDFGVIKDSLQPEGYNVTLTNGFAYYSSLVSIHATQPNSTIIGNATDSLLGNEITITGGANNFIVGGLGHDSIYFDSGGGVIADFATCYIPKGGDGRTLATSTSTSIQTSTQRAYRRFDTGSYCNQEECLVVSGTATGIYFDRTSTNTKAKKIATLDVVITYTDTNDTEQVILLKNIVKYPTTTNGSKASNRVYKTHSEAVGYLKIYQGETQVTPSFLFSDITDFPVSLRPVLINLYNIYNNSGYTNCQVTMGAYTQVFPDWLPQ